MMIVIRYDCLTGETSIVEEPDAEPFPENPEEPSLEDKAAAYDILIGEVS